jgi:uncharacterized protein (DUF1330 family)
MIILTQIIYLKEDKEEIFNQFEDIAIPLIAVYGGNLMLRLRPGKESMIAGSLELPYEIHVVSFPGDAELLAYGQDETRRSFLHLKEESIRTMILVNGKEVL